MPEASRAFLALFSWLTPITFLTVVTIVWFRKRARRGRSRLSSTPLLFPIVLRDITLRRETRPVLDAVILSLDSGTIAVVVGANGTGKTSLLEIAAGRLVPSSGECLMSQAAVDMGQESWRSRVSFCPADGGVIDYLTVAEHLAMAATLVSPGKGIPSSVRADRLGQLWGLSTHLHDRGATLSDGLRTRLGLALALVPRSDLYLFDEPTVSLDADGVRVLIAVLQRLRASQAAAVITTHSPELIGPVASTYFSLVPGDRGSTLEDNGSELPPEWSSSSDGPGDGEPGLAWLFP